MRLVVRAWYVARVGPWCPFGHALGLDVRYAHVVDDPDEYVTHGCGCLLVPRSLIDD